MKFNNEHTIYSIHVVKLLTVIFIMIITTLLITSRLGRWFEDATGLSRWLIVIVLALLYIALVVYFKMRRTAYFSYNDEGTKIVIKSYLIGKSSKKALYEINKNSLYKFEIDKAGLREELTLYTRNGTKVSKYPPLSITSITTAERAQLVESLNLFAEIRQKSAQ